MVRQRGKDWVIICFVDSAQQLFSNHKHAAVSVYTDIYQELLAENSAVTV